jgi:hypothetical protein
VLGGENPVLQEPDVPVDIDEKGHEGLSLGAREAPGGSVVASARRSRWHRRDENSILDDGPSPMMTATLRRR